MGSLELNVRRLGLRFSHVELRSVAVDDTLSGQALHVDLLELV